ncbi:conserved hypothetical protein [Culex quinquefasciatus]|uniref:Uncharacterized protein n=1 Tax=Culex quinquefasciatus TaxID=7176 RepID=B0W4B6_CULQU|nr:conserved hypothetical protein [Culex quinquefasciatus]|eukprot:XP_001843558.1 conserved hypothetical protein [Culex quinquefasciatus]
MRLIDKVRQMVLVPVSPKYLRISSILIAIYKVLVAHVLLFIMLLGLAHAEEMSTILGADIADQKEREEYVYIPTNAKGETMNQMRFKSAANLASEFNLAYLPDSDENKKHYMDVWLGEDVNDLARATEDEEADDRVLNISPLPDVEFSNDTSISLPLEIRGLMYCLELMQIPVENSLVCTSQEYTNTPIKIDDCAVVSHFKQIFGNIVQLAPLIPVVPQLRSERLIFWSLKDDLCELGH